MAKIVELNKYRMKWNVKDIAFLYPPDVFTGAFDNEKMEMRHREEVEKKLAKLKGDLAAADDPVAAMTLLHKKDHLQFLVNNVEFFREALQLEETLIALYTRNNTPFSSEGDAELWNRLFATCDRTRLRQCGSPLPFRAATVYRGTVSGCRHSLIWTPDQETVARIARKWQAPDIGGGEMFEVDVQAEQILVYLQKRRGEEVILAPEFIACAPIRAYGRQS
ncbi:MAG: hypothetical protein ACK5PS_10470 [Desulfopila sp.]